MSLSLSEYNMKKIYYINKMKPKSILLKHIYLSKEITTKYCWEKPERRGIND